MFYKVTGSLERVLKRAIHENDWLQNKVSKLDKKSLLK